MPSKKFYSSKMYGGKYRKGKRYSWSRKPYSLQSKVDYLSKQVSNLKHDEEYKWLDTQTTSFTIGLVVPLNVVPLGTDSVARTGRKIVMKSLNLRFYGASATATGAPRLLIVYDRNPHSVQPLITDVLTDATFTGQINLANRERFEILYDNTAGLKRGHDPVITYATTDGATFLAMDYIKMNHTTIFSAMDSGNPASLVTGGLYAMFVGTGTGSLVGNMHARLRFVDG